MHNRQMKKYFLLLIVCFQLSLAGFAQDAGLRSWSVAEGLAQSQVYCMMEDSRGFLWFGTQGGGLSRFDGMRFTNFQQRDGLVNDYILSMAEGQDGQLWFGTRDGISGLTESSFRQSASPPKRVLPSMGFIVTGRAAYGLLAIKGCFSFLVTLLKCIPQAWRGR
jgi:ligand-binding sensor domain-containing protein